jgi:hypothetical protein
VLRNIFGANVMRDVVTPVLAGTVGFILDRYAGNMASMRIAQLADPRYGKLAAAAVLIPATFAAAKMSPMVRANAGALVLGIGLATAESFLRNTPLLGGAPMAAVIAPPTPSVPTSPPATGSYYSEGMLAGLGRGYDLSHAGAPYQGMLGLGGGATMYAAAGVGEYVDQPMSGLGYAEGVDPANMATVDRTMNVMEAAAGSPMEAAAGMGVMYAAAGLGDEATMGEGEADAQLAAMYAKRQPPWVSTVMPVSGALPVTGTLPLDREIKGSLVTPEGKGFAGGLFARHLFAGMF